MKKKVVILFSLLPLIFNTNVCFAEDYDNIFNEGTDLGVDVTQNIELHTDIYCVVDGSAVNISGCVLKEDRVYVPIKPIFEAMGYTVKYSPQSKRVGLTNGDTKILIDIGKGIITGKIVSIGKEVELNAVLSDSVELRGAVYIPIRNIGESMYCDVDWEQDTSTVKINSPDLSDVVPDKVYNFTILEYLSAGKTEYFENFISIFETISHQDSLEKKLNSLKKIQQIDYSTSLEIESTRVVLNLIEKITVLSSMSDKPEAVEESWNSPSFKGLSTHKASVLEAKRLADRLYSENVISYEGRELIKNEVLKLEELSL